MTWPIPPSSSHLTAYVIDLSQLNHSLVCHSLLPSNPQYPSQVLALEAIYLLFIVLGAPPTTISRTGQTKVLNRRVLVLLPIPLAAQTRCFLQTAHNVFATSTPLEDLNGGSTYRLSVKIQLLCR